MAFAQLTYRESLRDIESCLRAMGNKLYHLGIRGKVSRSTLARANNKRDWRIYADFANVLISQARELYSDKEFGVDLRETVYALDASVIDLCLTMFPWATFRKTKAGVKLHTLLDIRGNIPSFVAITEAKCHDVNILDELVVEPGAFYVMDRGYVHFARLYRMHRSFGWFVIRPKRGMQYYRVASAVVDKSTDVRSDQTIRLTGINTSNDYPDHLRRIRYFDKENKRYFVYLTNNFILPAKTIALLYKLRWQVELFFKWIKQHLRIKAFYGTSSNAVKTQIWIAIAIYVLVAIAKKRFSIEASLYNILQVLSLSLFEKMPILSAFQALDEQLLDEPRNKQLELFSN